jgi:predicted acyltransferase
MANDKSIAPAAKAVTTRIASLDQFRGYTVAGMFLVNFLGAFAVTPMLLKHHNTFFSYADTIMPQFFFAVGFAFRLTFGRREQTQGLAAAYGHAARRLLGLALVALVVYKAPTAGGQRRGATDEAPPGSAP